VARATSDSPSRRCRCDQLRRNGPAPYLPICPLDNDRQFGQSERVLRLRNLGVVAAVVLFSAGCGNTSTEFVDTNGTAPNPEQSVSFPAWWVIDPSWIPTAESTSVRLIVEEKQCASGISPEGRIEAAVSYSETEVAITVRVNTVGGDANCPSNFPTPFTVQLTEPLGDRAIVGEDPFLA